MRVIECFQLVDRFDIAPVRHLAKVIFDIDDHGVKLGFVNQLKNLFISGRIAYRMAGQIDPPYFFRRVVGLIQGRQRDVVRSQLFFELFVAPLPLLFEPSVLFFKIGLLLPGVIRRFGL